MYNNYQDYQRDIIESQLMQRIDWEQEQADMVMQYMKRRRRIEDEIAECEAQIQQSDQTARRQQEMEDLRLAADLREMAERLEARYK